MKKVLAIFMVFGGMYLLFVGIPINLQVGNYFWVVYDLAIGLWAIFLGYVFSKD